MGSTRLSQALTRGRTTASTAFRNESGAFDLPSIIVGVVVVGILTAGVLAAIFGVIPFSQDKAAQQDLASVTTAQGVAKSQHEGYRDKAGLEDLGLVSDLGAGFKVLTLPTGDWCAQTVSGSGTTFSVSGTNPTPREGAHCGQIGSGLPGGEEPAPEADLTAKWEIEDDYLRGAIATQMGMDLMESESLTLADAQTLNVLSFSMENTPSITSLAGIEHATNLQQVELYENQLIDDFTPLTGLNELKILDISNAYEPNLDVIASIDSLQILNISYIQGSASMDPLATMPNLQELYFIGASTGPYDPSYFDHLAVFEDGFVAPAGP